MDKADSCDRAMSEVLKEPIPKATIVSKEEFLKDWGNTRFRKSRVTTVIIESSDLVARPPARGPFVLRAAVLLIVFPLRVEEGIHSSASDIDTKIARR